MGSCVSTLAPVASAAPDAATRHSPSQGCAKVAEAAPVSLVKTRAFPGEAERDRALRACNMLDTPPEPRFDAITKLMACIFDTPVSLLTLIVDDRVWFKSKVGPFGTCVQRDGSWCSYILVPSRPEVLITEDASQDARFAANPYVVGEPFVRFYAGAPLIGAGGMRYGTLCVVDTKPRSFSAEMYSVLTQFATMAVQELERDQRLVEHVQLQAASFADSDARMGGAVSSAVVGLAMIDVRTKPWSVLYANDAFAQAAGQGVDDCTQQGFWQQFDLAGKDGHQSAPGQVDATVAAGNPVRVTVCCKASRRLMSLVLQPAAREALSPDQPVAIPSWVRSESELGPSVRKRVSTDSSGSVGSIDPHLASCFYLAVLEVPTEQGQADGMPPQAVSLPIAVAAAATALAVRAGPDGSATAGRAQVQSAATEGGGGAPAGLALGPLLGSGSFAKVYRGAWNGSTVAVKVIDCDRPNVSIKQVVAEAHLSRGLVHPNIVRTHAYDVGANVLANGEQLERGAVYIMQQLCNRGTLIDAVEKGWFRTRRSLASRPNMLAILRTLRDVASGMAFLHSQSIIHRDLTGNNVLLDSSDADARGFVACVGDFGLARIASEGMLTTDSHGTVSHMAPEVLTDSLVTPAADVWSFGVLCWELFSGTRAYVGLRPANVMFMVMSGKAQLQLPDQAPQGYQDLVGRCLCAEWKQRPAFSEVLVQLDTLLEDWSEKRT